MLAPRLRLPALSRLCVSLALCAPTLTWSARQTPEPAPPTDAPATTITAPPAARTPAAKTPRANTRVSRQWRNQRFVYKAEGKRVSEVLMDFAASQGLPAVMADGIEGMVQATFDTTPEKFLDSMARAYGIVWYHDGTALYFYPAGSVQSRLFRLKGFKREQVAELLESLQLGDSRFPLRFNANESTLLVYGPPRHVELIAAAIESLDVGAMERGRKTVRVVPLRFASAGDRNFGQTRIRGVASTLTSLYGGATNGPAAAADAPTMVEVQPEKLRALQGVMGRDNRLADVMARKPGQTTTGQPSQKGAGSSGSSRGLQSPVDDDTPPVFEADEGTNSVVIHGRPQRMDEYIDLIRRLDVQPVLVELEATIIDVSSDSIESLGIDWNLKGSKSSLGVTGPAGDTSGTFTLSTLWSNAGRELMARINALSARGKAKVVAKPKVLGVANRPAVMREKRVVTVRVAGNLEANVFQIEAGTLLQVTPQITSIPDGSGVSRRIKLSLYIEDGSFEADRVDNVPIVKRTEIMTEAHVGEGESLLIGGITTTNQSTRRDEVPVLGRVPLLGGLFRQTSELSGSSERLFLISPRLIREPLDLPPTAAGTSSGLSGVGPSRGEKAPMAPASAPAPTLSTPVPESFMHDAGSAS